MTIADKIVALRRQQGWTQDDLAERLDVSRQSVSKWEGGLASPGLDKIVEMSRLFGVTTDYLLKDDLNETGPMEIMNAPETPLRQVTMAEAREFLEVKAQTAKPMALGVMLCILSPICLLLLSGVAGLELLPLSETLAVGLGLLALLLFVVPAVALFVSCGMKTEKFEYLEKEVFETAPGVAVLARERMEEARPLHSRRMVTGVSLCVASVIPIFGGIISQEPFLLMCAICLLLVMVAVGVRLIVLTGAIWGGYQMLLQEGDYAPEYKGSLIQTVSGVYWCAVTAGYLAYSFITNRWDVSWIVWPVAGVAFGGIYTLLAMASRRNRS